MTNLKLNPGEIIEPYQVIRLLSEEGGTSQIYLVQEVNRPGYDIVLKIHLTHSTPGNPTRDLLTNEVELLPTLRHPSIVRILPIYLGDISDYSARYEIMGQPCRYFTMEYITGGSLDEHMESIATKFPLAWKMELFYQLASTVQYLNQCGYTHSDLKPANVLLRRKPDPGELPLPVLIDFGCAVSHQNGLLQKAFTDRYAPPEVGEEIERTIKEGGSPRHPRPPAIDIWSLGAILLEMIIPPNKERKKTIRTAVISDEIRRARERKQDVPSELERLLVEKLLTRRVEERISIKELIKEIEERQNSLRPPRISRPVGLLSRFRR